MICSHIFAPTCSLEESTLSIGQSQSAIIGQSQLTNFTENKILFLGHRLHFLLQTILKDFNYV